MATQTALQPVRMIAGCSEAETAATGRKIKWESFMVRSGLDISELRIPAVRLSLYIDLHVVV